MKKKKKEREREKVQWKKTRSIVNFNEIQVQKGFEGRGGKNEVPFIATKAGGTINGYKSDSIAF